MRWIRRLLATATIAPLVVWALCLGLAFLLWGMEDCAPEEIGFACNLFDTDRSEWPVFFAFLAGWGAVVFLPVSLIAGALWAGLGLFARRRGRNRAP